MDWSHKADIEKALLMTVRTWEAAHPSLEQGLEEAKGALLKCSVEPGPNRDRAWKLLMIFDRLMYARLPAKQRSEDDSATQFRKRAVIERLRLFWRGDWSG